MHNVKFGVYNIQTVCWSNKNDARHTHDRCAIKLSVMQCKGSSMDLVFKTDAPHTGKAAIEIVNTIDEQNH